MSFRKVLKTAVCAVFVLALVNSNFAYAQASGGSGATDAQTQNMSGTRRQIAIIIFSGLAGGILGLSTLSFYGRPQDHLSNIALGFAVGIISGTVYTGYKAATRPYETFDSSRDMPNSEMSKRAELKIQSSEAPLFAYTWSFK